MNAQANRLHSMQTLQSSHSFSYCAGTCAPALHTHPKLTLIEGGRSQSQRNATRTQSKTQASAFSKQLPLVVLLGILGLSMFMALQISTGLKQSHYAAAIQDLVLENHIVMPGDSLWSIAQAHGITSLTTQETVRFIEQHNQLDQSLPLMPGQVISVPQAP